MRRRIAGLLAFVLMFAAMHGVVPLQAASTKPLGFEMTKEILKEEAKGLELTTVNSGFQETALAKWDVGSDGYYRLSYNIEARGNAGAVVTKKVDLEFYANGKNVDFTGRTYNYGNATAPISSPSAETNTYRVRTVTNGTWSDGATTTDSVISAQLVRDGVSLTSRELNLVVNSISMPMDGGKSETLNIRIKFDGTKILVYTNGVAKGNLTKFLLETKVLSTDTYAEVTSEMVFNGPKNYAIEPIHLTSDSSITLTQITDPQAVKPGSMPGIKISFDKIREINSSGVFTEVTGAAASQKAIIALTTENPSVSETKSMRLDFVPKVGGAITANATGSTATGTVYQDASNTSKLAIYLSKQKPVGCQVDPIIWDALDKSMLVNGSFEYGDNPSIFWPANKGYTYLEYTISKTNDSQIKLDITPYKINTKATYNIYINNAGNFGEKSTPQMIYEYDPNKTNNASISTVVPTNIATYFKIEVKVDSNTYVSQIVYYNPNLFNAIPEVTQIKQIDNVYVVPGENNNTQPQAIGFDIEWLAPQDLLQVLTRGDLYYELLLDTNKDAAKSNTTYSKIFKVSLKDGNPVVEVAAGENEGELKSAPGKRYNPSAQSFTMENVVLKKFGEAGWQWIDLNDEHLNKENSEYVNTVVDPSKLKNGPMNYQVPGVYYLSLRTVFVDKQAPTQKVLYSIQSNKVSISLDNVKEIIPVPKNITATDITDKDKNLIREKIRYDNVDIENYVKKMLEPANKFLYTGTDVSNRYAGEYEIYLYQKKDKLNQRAQEVANNSLLARTITITSSSVIDLNVAFNGTKKDIDLLREGDVVPIIASGDILRGIGNGSFEIIGLDPNQVYYITIRTRLNPYQNGQLLSPVYSEFSSECVFTTTTKPVPPTPEDKVPPAPKKIWVIEQPNNNTVTLGWEKADFEPDAEVAKTYYEFIRTNKQLQTTEMGQDVETLVGADITRVGFRSDSPTANNPYMSTYLNSTGSWINLTPEQLASAFKLTDSTLNPNNVYYYYVRTVCMISGKSVRSTWIMVPVTTTPVAPPINLKVELAKDYSHNPKEEIVISFDAPVPAGANIPNDYEFEIAVQSELDSEYSTTKYRVVQLTSKQDPKLTPEGYTHFVYKLYDLKPNKRYDIKVRIKDKTKQLAAGESYPTSLYCDKVTTRTEYDEDTQKEENAYAEYLKKFDSAVEKLRRRPYWEVKKGTYYKYREGYISAEIAMQREYDLITNSEESEAYYYMPAKALSVASNAGTVLNIKLGDQTVSVRPYTLTEENEAIKKAIKLMNENDLKDYYIGIHVSTGRRSGAVNGETPISPEITINMELIYMNQEDLLTEDDIMIALNNLIAKERLDFIKELEKKVNKGIIADDVLQDLVDDAVADITSDHVAKVEKIIKREKRKTITINTIEKAILIINKTDSFAVNGYYYESKWESVPTYMAGEGFALEAIKLGSYIFTGQKSLVETVPEAAPYQTMIAKYGLADFFKIDNYSLKTVVTKEQVYGSVARMIGAPRGTDYLVYLRNNGIKGITAIGLAKGIRQDEAIYIIMQGYEKIYKRPIATIVIKNKQSVQNIGAFQAPYRPYVYAAVELKIVDNPNAKVLPSKQLSVKEVIQMLSKLQAK